MESNLNVEEDSTQIMPKKVLIATLHSVDPILVAANKLGPDRMYLLVDKELSKEQEKSIEILQGSLGRVIDIKIIKTEVYDIVEVAKKAVEIIDMQPKEDEIFANVTSGRKTKAIGLLFGAYARCSRVKKILYFPEETKEAVSLPKLQFNLTDSQKKVLEYIEAGKFDSLMDLSEKIDISRAMLYRNIKELEEMGLIEEQKLTDAGRIARL
jgi:CRISPR locus-related DNA-binding protein